MLVEELWRPSDAQAQAQLADALLREDLATALLAVEGATALEQREAMGVLADLGQQTQEALQRRSASSPERQVAALREVLAGFEGDRDDYYAPHNSYLSRVLRRRRGLPILLSSVWMLVGGRLGLLVEGIGLPGHFIARVGGEDGVLVDPFSGGKRLDHEACRRHIERAGKGTLSLEEALRAVSTAELLERVLRNLVNAHQLQRDPAAFYRAARLWSGIRPDLEEPRSLLARVEATLALGRPRSQAN
jgi:regulator of sirC expression with transglutaminase-like and TPR domain